MFRATSSDFAALDRRHLLLGLSLVWLVGVGRYWDNPRVSFAEQTGAGSLIYVFMFAGFLYWAVRPLQPRNWSYANLVAFVSLTAPPGLLYAIPVERFLDLETARAVNASFLGIVATWRVSLLFLYLRRHAQLGWAHVLVGTLLPLCFIVTVLWGLNLDRVVFGIMSGEQDPDSGNTLAYVVLTWITFLAVMLFVPLTCAYGYLWHRARHSGRVAA